MTIYKCRCKKQCPGSVRMFVENSENKMRVALEIWTATMSRHTIYLSPADAEALGEELRRVATVGLRSANTMYMPLNPKEFSVKTRRVLRPDDELPSIAELSGSDPNSTDDATTEEYIQWGRKHYGPS